MDFFEKSVKGWRRLLKGEKEVYDPYPTEPEPIYTKEHLKEIVVSKAFFLDICLILFIVGLSMFCYQKGEWAGMSVMCEDDEKPAWHTLNEKYICWNENENLMGGNDEIQLFNVE